VALPFHLKAKIFSIISSSSLNQQDRSERFPKAKAYLGWIQPYHFIRSPVCPFRAVNIACIACLYMVGKLPTITESCMLKWAFAHFFIF